MTQQKFIQKMSECAVCDMGRVAYSPLLLLHKLFLKVVMALQNLLSMPITISV